MSGGHPWSSRPKLPAGYRIDVTLDVPGARQWTVTRPDGTTLDPCNSRTEAIAAAVADGRASP